jgi:hypothetical protein
MTNKSTTTPTDMPEAAQKLGEQLVSAVKQSQNLALDAARAFAGAWSSVPSNLSEIPMWLRCPTRRRSRPTASTSPPNCLPRRRISL